MRNANAEVLQRWLQMWDDGIVHLDDAALTFEEAIVEDGNPAYFELAPAPIQDRMLQDIEAFSRSGTRVALIKGTDTEIDLTEKMIGLVQVLRQAGLLQIK